MNPRTKRKLEKINDRLQRYSQSTRVVDLSSISLTLASGLVLENNDANKFIKRVMNNKIIDWVKNIDKLLSGEITEDAIKSISFSVGGRACQAKHGHKIKNQLNTGTPWNKGTKGQRLGTLGPLSIEIKSKISKKNKGEGNGRYGYEYNDQEKKEKSILMQELISTGKFTPKLNNRTTRWESELDGVAYRSSWEALYKYINPDAEYEQLRLFYTIENVNKVYIVDFIDHNKKIAIEVKPKELCYGKKFQEKMKSLHLWANENNYSVLLVDKDWLLSHNLDIDYSRFNKKTAEKIRKLYEINKKNRD